MALRDQPYLPLYVQDIMTDEKLNECCAATHGIFIKGIMCLMHKSETYGKLLLKQNVKQDADFCLSFASQFVRHLPYTVEEICAAVNELIREKVCHIEGQYLVQKRMVSDNELSVKRSNSGKTGGEKTQSKNKNFAKANIKANSEYEYEYINEDVIINNKEKGVKKFKQNPLPEDIPPLPENYIRQAQQKVLIVNQYNITPDEIKAIFEVFKTQTYDGVNFCERPTKAYSHFLNWLSKQNFTKIKEYAENKGNTERNSTGRTHTFVAP